MQAEAKIDDPALHRRPPMVFLEQTVPPLEFLRAPIVPILAGHKITGLLECVNKIGARFFSSELGEHFGAPCGLASLRIPAQRFVGFRASS